MQISRDSWHYRLIDWCTFNHPHNLCAYFWKTVLAVVSAPVFILACAGLAVTGVIFVLAPLWWTFIPDAFFLAIIVGTAEVVFLSWLLGKSIFVRREEELRSGERYATEPTLLIQWLRAKHRKVCPLLKFN